MAVFIRIATLFEPLPLLSETHSSVTVRIVTVTLPGNIFRSLEQTVRGRKSTNPHRLKPGSRPQCPSREKTSSEHDTVSLESVVH